MSTCKKIEKQLLLYALDELSESERAAIEAHLAVCSDCRQKTAGFAALSGSVPRIDVSEQSVKPARRALFYRLRTQQNRQPKSIYILKPAFQLAILVLCTTVAFFAGRQGSAPLSQNPLLTASEHFTIDNAAVTPFLLSFENIHEKDGLITIDYNTVNSIRLRGALDDPMILTMLQQAITDHRDPVKQRRAIKAVAACRENAENQIDRLLPAIHQTLFSSSDYAVRQQCVKTLHCFDSQATQPLLMQIVQADTSQALRIQAFKALEDNLQQAQLEMLYQSADSSLNTYVRSKAHKMIESIQL